MTHTLPPNKERSGRARECLEVFEAFASANPFQGSPDQIDCLSDDHNVIVEQYYTAAFWDQETKLNCNAARTTSDRNSHASYFQLASIYG